MSRHTTLNNGNIEIWTFDVDPGSVWFIVTGDGETILINAGSTEIGSVLDSELAGRGIERAADGTMPIDLFVVMYLARNHVFGLTSLYEHGYEIQSVVQPADDRFVIREAGARTPGVADSVIEPYVTGLKYVHGVETIQQVSAGDSLPLRSDLDVTVLSPPATESEGHYTDHESGVTRFFAPGNPAANGIVLKLRAEKSALFMGDIGSAPDVEQWLIAQHHDPNSDIDLGSDMLYV